MTNRQLALLVFGLLLVGFALGALFMVKHQNCSSCQAKGAALINGARRRLGMAIIPNE